MDKTEYVRVTEETNHAAVVRWLDHPAAVLRDGVATILLAEGPHAATSGSIVRATIAGRTDVHGRPYCIGYSDNSTASDYPNPVDCTAAANAA